MWCAEPDGRMTKVLSATRLTPLPPCKHGPHPAAQWSVLYDMNYRLINLASSLLCFVLLSGAKHITDLDRQRWNIQHISGDNIILCNLKTPIKMLRQSHTELPFTPQDARKSCCCCCCAAAAPELCPPAATIPVQWSPKTKGGISPRVRQKTKSPLPVVQDLCAPPIPRNPFAYCN